MSGKLAEGEDAQALARTLVSARELVLSGQNRLLLHADPESDQGRVEERSKVAALKAGRLARYVLRLDTAAGPRIVKITEIKKLGNALLGLVATSTAKREHAYHERASALGLATVRSVGYLELRSGPLVSRTCQIQTLIPPELETLDTVLWRELSQHGDAALDPLAEAMATCHRAGFFHADLKGFHAHVRELTPCPDGPARYSLSFIDLARVSFALTHRRRVINLYQLFRFVLPGRPEAQERFMMVYTRATGWRAREPQLALAEVRRFLAHKYLTHPVA